MSWRRWSVALFVALALVAALMIAERGETTVAISGSAIRKSAGLPAGGNAGARAAARKLRRQQGGSGGSGGAASALTGSSSAGALAGPVLLPGIGDLDSYVQGRIADAKAGRGVVAGTTGSGTPGKRAAATGSPSYCDINNYPVPPGPAHDLTVARIQANLDARPECGGGSTTSTTSGSTTSTIGGSTTSSTGGSTTSTIGGSTTTTIPVPPTTITYSDAITQSSAAYSTAIVGFAQARRLTFPGICPVVLSIRATAIAIFNFLITAVQGSTVIPANLKAAAITVINQQKAAVISVAAIILAQFGCPPVSGP